MYNSLLLSLWLPWQWEMVTEEDATRTKWVPDHAATNCHSCNVIFNKLYYRKHHCRYGLYTRQCHFQILPIHTGIVATSSVMLVQIIFAQCLMNC